MDSTADIVEAATLKPATIVGKYQIIELIAKGGMAEVYKAKRYGAEGFEKILVLKRILPEFAENREFVDLFINEAKIAMHLNHTNIVQVLDLDQERNEYFIAMEYVYGLNLSETIRNAYAKNMAVPPELITFIASEAAKGLDYAHRRRGADMRPLGIVHRDISPQNILVSFEGEVKITDFGIAAAKHVIAREADGFVKGKFAYMAPEQALGEKVDARADIFSLGVIMYEMASGQNPFRQPTGRLTIERIIRHELLPLSETAPHVPREFTSIVETCMQADPEKRFQNAGRLYEELLAFIFTTGKRVSSSTVSGFMRGLRDAAKSGDGTGIDGSLEEAVGRSELTPEAIPVSSIVEITNVAIPVHGKKDRAKDARKEEKPDLSVEQHDFTLMSIEYLSSDSQKEKNLLKISKIVDNEGGRILDEAKGYAVALFGMGEISGRDTEAAMSCATKIKHVARNLRKREGRILPVSACIKPLRLSVDKTGKPIEDENYLKAILETRETAQKHSDKIIISAVKAEDIEEKFEVERADMYDASLGASSFVLLREKLRKYPTTKFIDRKNSLQQIAEILAATSRSSGRIAGVVGDAGIGKSRFIEEIHSRLRHKSKIFWYQTTCGLQQQDIPLSSFAAILWKVTGMTEDDTERSALEKVGRLLELGASKEEIEATASLMGLAAERSSGLETFYPLIQSVISKIARRLSQDRLTVFAWENIRYMDQESESTIDFLLNEISQSRVLILLTYRTGFVPRWAKGGRFKEIVLGSLTDADCTKLIMETLGNPSDIPWELLTEIITKSGGNPLFLEEYIKALKLSGAIAFHGKKRKVMYHKDMADVGLPKTLKGIFAERLAKLSDDNKDLLKVASVIGNRFNVDVLSEVIGSPMYELAMRLEELESDGILTRLSLMEYSFNHDFIKETVYDSLPHESRKNLHENVAGAIEASPSGRMEEIYNILAHHWRESGNRKKATEYLMKSADRMAADYHYSTALQQYLKAADLIRTSPTADFEQLLDVYDRIGDMSISAAKTELGLEKMKLAADLAEEIGDRKRLVLAVTKLGRIATVAGKFSDAQRNFSRALELSEGLTDLALRKSIYGAIGMMHVKNGEYLQAAGFLEEAVKLSRQTGDSTAEQSYTRQLAQTMAAQNKKELAMEHITRAEKQADDTNDKFVICELYKSRALVHFMLREWDEAHLYSEKALELAREYNFTYEIAINSHNIGDIHVRQNNYKKAFTSLRFSYELSREYGFKKLEVINMAFLGYIDAVRFGSTEGIDKIKAGIKYAIEKQYSWDVVQGKFFLGKAHFKLREYKEAKEALRDAINIGKATGNLMYVDDSSGGRSVPAYFQRRLFRRSVLRLFSNRV
ncbi:MAG: protein kinase [Pseudomonadota bacterium]